VSENGLLSTSVPRTAAHGPGYGILFALGEDDTIVDTSIEEQSFDTLCAQGVPLQFLECAGAGHLQTTQWALPEIVAFVAARFAHQPIDAALRCQRGGPVHCLGELGASDAGGD
jgi:hypothetical protein